MTILDLINKSAIMLNIQEVLNDNALADITANTEANVIDNNFALKRLYEFSKIVLNEISSYLSKIAHAEYSSKDNKIPLSVLDRLSKIISIKNEFGYVKYKLIDDNIVVDENGVYTITFNQYPQANSLLNEIELNSEIGEDVLVYGLNSYYCLATGLLNEYNVYNAHYIDRLSKINNLKLFSMPCRSWE